MRNIPSSKPRSAKLETFIHRIVKGEKTPALKTTKLVDERPMKVNLSLIFYDLTEHCRSGGNISLYEATWSFALRRAECR